MTSPLPPPDAIDWSRAWLAPYRDAGRRVAGRIAAGASVAEALNAERPPGFERRFAGHEVLPAGAAYESYIAGTGTIPTRDDLHDLFNGLAWLRWPALKGRLNALQASAIARHGVGAARGALRDALTLFDENGAVLDAPAPLVAALRARDWRAAFVDRRDAWRPARLLLFGHALLQKLCAPRKAITAHVVVGDPLALDADGWAAKPFVPLPVLGVPGWWPANEAPAFYDDAAVFRPARRAAIDPAG